MKTVTHKDTVYNEEDVKSITQLRKERWVLLAQLCKQPARKEGPYLHCGSNSKNGAANVKHST